MTQIHKDKKSSLSGTLLLTNYLFAYSLRDP